MIMDLDSTMNHFLLQSLAACLIQIQNSWIYSIYYLHNQTSWSHISNHLVFIGYLINLRPNIHSPQSKFKQKNSKLWAVKPKQWAPRCLNTQVGWILQNLCAIPACAFFLTQIYIFILFSVSTKYSVYYNHSCNYPVQLSFLVLSCLDLSFLSFIIFASVFVSGDAVNKLLYSLILICTVVTTSNTLHIVMIFSYSWLNIDIEIWLVQLWIRCIIMFEYNVYLFF